MADIALRLKVFVASPGDLRSERDIVERLVGNEAEECKRHRLLLDCFRWENGTTPGYERPQSKINRQLRTAELTVVMFWTRLGSAATFGGQETAALEELRIAGEQAVTGAADDLFVYFKTAPPPPEANVVDVDRVRQLRERLEQSKEAFLGEFNTQLEFETLFRRHLRFWIERWFGVPEICEFALDHSSGGSVAPGALSDSRLHAVLSKLDLPHVRPAVEAVGRFATHAYQREGPMAWVRPLSAELVSELRGLPRNQFGYLLEPQPHALGESPDALSAAPLSRANGEVHFSDQEWFFFCCAVGLTQAIISGDVTSVARYPYSNPVHQYLKGLALEWKLTKALVPVLRQWLTNGDGATANRPIARNFAAYVLGILGASEAQEDLARAIAIDSGKDVRLYCVTSLGKLRARQQLPVLKELYAREPDPMFRLTIAQAICRMTGVAEYEL